MGFLWLSVATVEWGTTPHGDLLIVLAGLVWPHLAYWFAVSGKDTRRSGLAALAGDALIVSFAIAVMQFAALACGVVTASFLSMMMLLGGVPLLIRSTSWMAVGAVAGFFIWGFEPQFVQSGIAVRGLADLKSFFGQVPTNDLADRGFIIND